MQTVTFVERETRERIHQIESHTTIIPASDDVVEVGGTSYLVRGRTIDLSGDDPAVKVRVERLEGTDG